MSGIEYMIGWAVGTILAVIPWSSIVADRTSGAIVQVTGLTILLILIGMQLFGA